MRIMLQSLSTAILVLVLGNVNAQEHGRGQWFSDYNLTRAAVYPKMNVSENSGPVIEEISMSSPRVYLIHNLLTKEECNHLRSKAIPTLRSSYAGTGGQGMKVTPSRRTSKSTFLMYGSVFKTATMKNISRKISNYTGFDVSNFSDLQVNRYEAGGKYEPHVDWAATNTLEQLWTVLLCLSSLEEDQGGETVFPAAGIKVRGKEGMAIVFKNVIEPGKVDPKSLHGGAPLFYGTKWNSNQWILGKPVPFARRVSFPVLLRPWGGDPPQFVLRLRNYLMKTKGADAGYHVLNVIANTCFGIFISTSLVIIRLFAMSIFALNGRRKKAKQD